MQSVPDAGTTFTLSFPSTTKQCSQTDKNIPIHQYSGNENILVVDDVAEQREIASAILRKLGYSVDVVYSGEQSIEHLENNPAELIVLDMVMDPGMDGLDTYKEISRRHPGVKAIIATGYSETDRVKGARKLGVGAYIKKPYTLQKIGMAIRTELNSSSIQSVA